MLTKPLTKILRPAGVSFEKEPHTYKNSITGEFYVGTTTISEAWDKSFFLGPWHAKEAINAVIENLGEISALLKDNPKPKETPKLLELLNTCKLAAKEKGNVAKTNGTLAHDWIEKNLAIKISGKGKKPSMPESEEAQNAISAFIAWAKMNNVQWLASEEILANHEHKIAGTLDAIAVIDGITYLVDFKTSSQISPSYLLQCAGYDLMLREMGLQVMGYMILRLPKDGTKAETLTITNQEDMKFFRETFIKQREAHRFYVYAESKFKDATTKKMKVDEAPKKEIKTKAIKVKKSVKKK